MNIIKAWAPIRLLMGILLLSGAAFGAESEASFFSRFVDENAKLNIEQVYLPYINQAIQVSKSKKLNHQQKQAGLYEVLQNARESLKVQRAYKLYYLVSPGVNYKLEQFHSAIAAGDFEQTAEMAASAKAVALQLID